MTCLTENRVLVEETSKVYRGYLGAYNIALSELAFNYDDINHCFQLYFL